MPALFTLWGQRSQSVIGFSVLSVVYNKQDQGARHCLPRPTLENKFITEQNKHLWSDQKRLQEFICQNSHDFWLEMMLDVHGFMCYIEEDIFITGD